MLLCLMAERSIEASEPSFVALSDGTQLSAEFVVECRWVTNRLAIGGMVGTRQNAVALERLGVSHVLNLQAEFDDAAVFTGSAIRLAWVPVEDRLQPFPADAVLAAIAFGCDALAQQHARLFVHCLAGRTRSPLFAYAILRASGVSAAECVHSIRAAEARADLDGAHLDAIERVLAGDAA